MLAEASSFHIPAAAGTKNAANTTASQNRNTLMPAVRIASPSALLLPARLPMIALPTIPATTRTPQSGAAIHGARAARSLA